MLMAYLAFIFLGFVTIFGSIVQVVPMEKENDFKDPLRVFDYK